MYDGGELGISLYRFGGGTDGGSPLFRRPDVSNAQTSLNDVANRSPIDETAKLLLNSLAGEKQTVYFRSWEMRPRFCDAREISPWVDTSMRNLDVDVLSF